MINIDDILIKDKIKIERLLSGSVFVKLNIQCEKIFVFKKNGKSTSTQIAELKPNIFDNNSIIFSVGDEALFNEIRDDDPVIFIKIINFNNSGRDEDIYLKYNDINRLKARQTSTHVYGYRDKNNNLLYKPDGTDRPSDTDNNIPYHYDRPLLIENIVGDTLASSPSKVKVYKPDPNNDKNYLFKNGKMVWLNIEKPSGGLICTDTFSIDYKLYPNKNNLIEFKDETNKINDKIFDEMSYFEKGIWEWDPISKSYLFKENFDLSNLSFNEFKRSILAVAHAANAYRNILSDDVEKWLSLIGKSIDPSIKQWDKDLVNKILENVRYKDEKTERLFGNMNIIFDEHIDLNNNSKFETTFNINNADKYDMIQIKDVETDKIILIKKTKLNNFKTSKLKHNKIYSINFIKINETNNIKYELIVETPISTPKLNYQIFKKYDSNNANFILNLRLNINNSNNKTPGLTKPLFNINTFKSGFYVDDVLIQNLNKINENDLSYELLLPKSIYEKNKIEVANFKTTTPVEHFNNTQLNINYNLNYEINVRVID